MPLGESLDPANIKTTIGLVIVLAGLPVLAVGLIRWRIGGLGGPPQGAWPAVTWGRSQWGLPFVLVLFLCQSLLQHAAVYGLDRLLDPEGLAGLPGPTRIATLSLATVAHWAVVCGGTLVWLSLSRNVAPDTLGLSSRRLAKSAGYGLVLLLAAEPLITAALLAGSKLHTWLSGPAPVHPVLVSLSHATPPVQMVVLLVTAGLVIPFFEELFFRGIVQTTLMRSGHPIAAITATSLLFGLVHLPVPTSVVPLTILGWAMGYAFYRTRSLASCFAMHSVFNLISLSVTVLPQMARGGA